MVQAIREGRLTTFLGHADVGVGSVSCTRSCSCPSIAKGLMEDSVPRGSQVCRSSRADFRLLNFRAARLPPRESSPLTPSLSRSDECLGVRLQVPRVRRMISTDGVSQGVGQFVRDPLGWFMVNMLLCDLLQGAGFAINLHWAAESALWVGGVCTAQGAVTEVGDVGTSSPWFPFQTSCELWGVVGS